MPNPPLPSLPSAPETWAEVRARDHVMRYRRRGAGRAVLVLRSADGPEPLWPALADALAERFRVILPEVPAAAAGADVARWLTDFLEGLGAADVAVVAADALCIPALELALLDSDRIARLVLVPGGRGEETVLDGALATSRDAAIPLLVVRRGIAEGEAVAVVTRFLAGEG